VPENIPRQEFRMPAAPLKFAYWVPNVSGGLVTSDIEQRTDWNYEYNKKLAQTAENNGFEYALSQVRYMASYGAEFQHESTSFSLALLLATERLKVIAAVHPGLWHPGVLAKFGATADHLSNGRFAVNVVSGWFKGEFTALGEPWLEHDERYRRSEEFIRALRQIWTEDHTELAGDFYRLRDFTLKPKPLNTPERPHPEIFQGGNSTAARAMAGRVSTGTSPTARTSTALSNRSRTYAPPPTSQAARHRGSASTASSSPVTPRPRPATPSGRSSPTPTVTPSRASAPPSNRPGSPPPTARACGRTPPSRT
jgi:alkanesulfonate monooxygenase SsuD/methylene tetrahydromethanopterin reductase-like flavin-dependent oxidoreductase (luciferase family)